MDPADRSLKKSLPKNKPYMVLNLQGFNASIKARPIYIRDLRRKNTEWWRPNDATKNDDVYHDNDDNNNI